jgi:hypothetical protein
MADIKRWIVTTSPDRPIAEIARKLAAAGFAVEAVNEEINSISGTATDQAVAKMRSVPGVADVSPDVPIEIGPPGSDETW